MLYVGQVIEISKGYNMDTRCHDRDDEISGCDGVIVRIDRNDVLVEIRGLGEWWVTRGRVKTKRAA